ncbi:MAG: orotidine-5'-phosphate decarboxylase, partial [Hyphomicrobiales bacterium]|nr:orotidine-5'-phosphate decarboxylase [Hyphomicrobiales bacterium]
MASVTDSADANNPLFLALDISDIDTAASIAKKLKPHIGGVKLGMEFFYNFGARGYERIRETGLPIFLDLKLHDIPATVSAAVRTLARLSPAMLTIHAGGGIEMMRAALSAAKEADAPPRIVAVGMLTSLEDADLKREGIPQTAEIRTRHLADNAIEAGINTLVCSPREITPLRERFGGDVSLVTPGIRPEGAKADDQKRTMTPEEAYRLGADILVIGRPILHAGNPEA